MLPRTSAIHSTLTPPVCMMRPLLGSNGVAPGGKPVCPPAAPFGR